MHQTLTLTPIGVVRSPVREGVDEGWGSVTSRVELNAELAGALAGMEEFSHALVVFFMHRSSFDPDTLQRRPQGREDLPVVGVLAQRAKHRPNPIGVTAVQVVAVEPDALVVRGLDAIDGTPVLDVKPYFPWFDRVDGARTPEWCGRIMDVYF